MSRRGSSAALWVGLLPWVGGCLTDLAVGLSELESEGPATTVVDAGTSPERDAASTDASRRDASDLDARVVGDAASCNERTCPDVPDATARDASMARDASAPRDAASRDAAPPDAAAADAGEACLPSDCEYVGLVVTFSSCERGREPVCVRTDKGICDLVCPGPARTDLAREDAATQDGLDSRRDGGSEERTREDDAGTLSETSESSDGASESKDGAAPEQDGAAPRDDGGAAQPVARDD